MPDRPIIGNDAALYIENVERHGLREDIRWLMDVGRFPVGSRILDVGCGTGTLVAALAGETQYSRSVIGIELSPDLVKHARNTIDGTNGVVSEADFVEWIPPTAWLPDTIVMSYFLHHCDNYRRHLERAASLLTHGGRLYVVDRVAVNDRGIVAFEKFWKETYRDDHEWFEEKPQLTTVDALKKAAASAGFDFVRRLVCPHDHRVGVGEFPKTLFEFWRHEPGHRFPAILVVSPAHVNELADILNQLALAGLRAKVYCEVPYTDELIRALYQRCPWRESLLQFVAEKCPERKAIALLLEGDHSSPALLDGLGQFKKTHREKWMSIYGPMSQEGVRAIILPFHVPEPYESESLANAIGYSR